MKVGEQVGRYEPSRLTWPTNPTRLLRGVRRVLPSHQPLVQPTMCCRRSMRCRGWPERESSCVSRASGLPPSQAWEFRVVAVRRNPLASRLDRERGEPGVLYEVAGCPRIPAQTREDIPVPDARLNDGTVFGFEQRVTEVQGLREAAGLDVDTRVRADAKPRYR